MSNVVEFCNALPSSYKLKVLDEKHVLKRAVSDLVPAEILDRPKQPYRAPDAASFLGEASPEYVDDVLSPSRVEEAGVFDPSSVAALLAKCRSVGERAPLSNADNMAFVGRALDPAAVGDLRAITAGRSRVARGERRNPR